MAKLIALLLLSLSTTAYSHYNFWKLIVNDTTSEGWQYVRNVSVTYDVGPWWDYGVQWNPLWDLESTDTRCGRGALHNGADTGVATVVAGSKVGVRTNSNAYSSTEQNMMYHGGYMAAYMSKAENVRDYDGSGEWFKIAEQALNTTDPKDVQRGIIPWLNWLQGTWNYTIPKSTPPGQYLLRTEHAYVRRKMNETQLYVNCAQIEVVGAGGGSPGPLVKIPGAYNNFDLGFWIWKALEWRIYGDGLKLDLYKVPGPAVWEG